MLTYSTCTIGRLGGKVCRWGLRGNLPLGGKFATGGKEGSLPVGAKLPLSKGYLQVHIYS